MTERKVTVAMAVRDGSRYVAEAVESILAQTLGDFEFVIVDDGSSDGTPAIVAELARRDSRIRLVTGPSRGLVAALNEACGCARTTYVARMDADDVAEPARLASQLRRLDEDPTLVLLGTAVTQMDERGTAFSTRSYPVDPGDELLEWNCFAHPTVVFRRDAFERAGGYRSLFPHAEDYDLWLRLAELGRVANLAEPLLRYRLHESQVTRRQLEQQVVSALAAQAAARLRRSTGSEPLPEALTPSAGAVRRGVLSATTSLAASMIDISRVDEAAAVLRTGRELFWSGTRGDRIAFCRQVLRLGGRRLTLR